MKRSIKSKLYVMLLTKNYNNGIKRTGRSLACAPRKFVPSIYLWPAAYATIVIESMDSNNAL